MSKYNYKCVVNNTGSKRYYKNVRGKWKRITNAVGMKAELKYRAAGDRGVMTDKTRCNEYIEEDKVLKCNNGIRVINDGKDISSEFMLHVTYQQLIVNKWGNEETFTIDQLKLDNKDIGELMETLNVLDKDEWQTVKENGDFKILKKEVPIRHVKKEVKIGRKKKIIDFIDFGLKLQKKEDGKWNDLGRLISNDDWDKKIGKS